MMERKKSSWLGPVCAAILLLAVTGALCAQGGPSGPRPGEGFRTIGPDDALGFVGFEAGFSGKTVTGAPFTADYSTETTDVLPDGNQIDRKITGTFARDSNGRTRREMTLPAIGAFATTGGGGTAPHGIIITDPVGGVSYVLNESKKQARATTLHNNQNRGNNRRGRGPDARANTPNVTTQSLGTQTIAGVAAEGTRTIRTIPAGQIGNEKAIQLTVERWYSPDLQTDVLIKRSDPRGGTTVFQLMNIVRSEPDASLFQVPPDYTVVQGGGPRRGMGRPGPPPPQQ